MLTKNRIWTLANVVIVDPTRANLFCRSYAIGGFSTYETTQTKGRNYHNQHPINYFFFLAIEVFGCLDKQANVFFHNCVNAMWNFKGPKGLPFFVLVTFLCKKISITLQKMLASSILSQAIVGALVIS